MHALVVDDSRAMRMILRRTLTRLGFTVTEAADGQQGMDALAACETVPDVALVDWNMPHMGGLDLVQVVRADPGYDDMRLVVVSTENELGPMVASLDAGADEYLIKPFTADAVLSRLALLPV